MIRLDFFTLLRCCILTFVSLQPQPQPPGWRGGKNQPTSNSKSSRTKGALHIEEDDSGDDDEDNVQQGLEEIVRGVKLEKLDRYLSKDSKEGMDFAQRSR